MSNLSSARKNNAIFFFTSSFLPFIRGFIPSPGLLHHLVPPKTSSTVRVDTGVRQGDTVTTYYDPMIAKLVAWAPNRKTALQKLKKSLEEYQVKNGWYQSWKCILGKGF